MFLEDKIVEEKVVKKSYAPTDAAEADVATYYIIIKRLEDYIDQTSEEDDERAKDKLTLMLRDLLGEVKVEINEMAKEMEDQYKLDAKASYKVE